MCNKRAQVKHHVGVRWPQVFGNGVVVDHDGNIGYRKTLFCGWVNKTSAEEVERHTEQTFLDNIRVVVRQVKPRLRLALKLSVLLVADSDYQGVAFRKVFVTIQGQGLGFGKDSRW